MGLFKTLSLPFQYRFNGFPCLPNYLDLGGDDNTTLKTQSQPRDLSIGILDHDAISEQTF
jgi:hypothetical protein